MGRSIAGDGAGPSGTTRSLSLVNTNSETPSRAKQLPVGVQISEFQGRHAADLDRKEEMGPDHHP